MEKTLGTPHKVTESIGKEEAPIPRAVRNLEQQTEALEMALDMLGQKLTPVLCREKHAEKDCGGMGGGEVSPGQPLLTESLERVTGRLLVLTKAAQELHRRCEL
jgi:hypothetical protein